MIGQTILQSIDDCFISWYDSWKKAYLQGGSAFQLIYDLMEGLMHYENQIQNREIILSIERVNAIAQAVARLIDCGNAILNIGIIVRTSDELPKELDSRNITSIELFQAHIRAHDLREKLLNDYFKKTKPNSFAQAIEDTSCDSLKDGQARSQLSLIGSSNSINTIVLEGRKTPQIEIDTLSVNSTIDGSNQSEVAQMLSRLKSELMAPTRNFLLTQTLLMDVIDKVKALISEPPDAETIFCSFEILDALLDSIEKMPQECRTDEVVAISRELLKPIVQKIYIDDRQGLVSFQRAHWATCLVSVVRLMTVADFNNYLRQFNGMADLSAFLKDYLFIVKRIVSNRSESPARNDNEVSSTDDSFYPDFWVDMILLASSTFLTSLTYLYHILRQHFSSNLQMWTSFLDCLINFILEGVSRADKLPLRKRQRSLADSILQTSAEYIRITCDSLAIDQKQQLLEDIVEPLIRACMALNPEYRSRLLPIFYDMMYCDYTSQYISPDSTLLGSKPIIPLIQQPGMQESFVNMCRLSYQYTDQFNNSINTESLPYLSFDQANNDGTVLRRFTHLIVGKLYNLMIDLGLGNQSFKIEFCSTLAGNTSQIKNYSCRKLGVSEQFENMASQTSDLINEFMQICLDIRESSRLFHKHLYWLSLFKLILFFRDKVDRRELYLQNLYKLCYLHHSAGRFIEAGYTLLEQAKSLPWSNEPLENHFRIITRFFTTHQPLTDYSSLKTFLYCLIMEYFDQGQIWEASIPLCHELIEYYEFKTFDYGRLADIHQKMSNYFKNIVEPSGRANPEYFRVTFYGLGFSEMVRDMTLVFRGKPFQKLGDFQTSMLANYPDSKLLSSLAKPNLELLMQPNARYLHINACSPVVDLKSKFKIEISKIDDAILDYYRYNECDKFSFSRRISRSEAKQDKGTVLHGDGVLGGSDNFANIWRERITLTSNTLPGMLPFFPVYLIETSIVSPIESAIEDLERTNDRLCCMVNRFKADKRQAEDVRSLGQLLLGVVDAAVNGGISKYEEAFFGDHQAAGGRAEACFSTTSGSSIEEGGNFQHSLMSSLTSTKQYGKQDLASSVSDTECNLAQVDKLKCLIAGQLPLLDEAIRLHADRVAEVMRPQHEHLVASHKRLKQHIMSKYAKYLPQDYNRSSGRSFRSMARSPSRSVRSESRLPLMTLSSPGLTNSGPRRSFDSGRHLLSRTPNELPNGGQLDSKSADSVCSSPGLHQIRVNNQREKGSSPERDQSSGQRPPPPLLPIPASILDRSMSKAFNEQLSMDSSRFHQDPNRMHAGNHETYSYIRLVDEAEQQRSLEVGEGRKSGQSGESEKLDAKLVSY